MFGDIPLPLPWRVAVVRQCDVSRAQLVDGPQGGDAAVDPVAALDPDQTRDQLLLQRVLDACTFPLTSNSQMRHSRTFTQIKGADLMTETIPIPMS